MITHLLNYIHNDLFSISVMHRCSLFLYQMALHILISLRIILFFQFFGPDSSSHSYLPNSRI
ncbi:hypothetical protein PMAYCL1PPCAC_00374 [Pristionchus mayeri]|uniref:Uncharacterized protein n=1 Tax=Pristionchus mayeri TaxID=1317129 RepID=A0AAN4YYK0_9BILA|nr:hypothetical protein PMAYCL1PPCAC_00374 [Pristionchus mayeri]